MSPEKKASEGIALLSMYGDEDDEMEELDEEGENRHGEDIPPPTSDADTVKDNDAVSDYGNENVWQQQGEKGLDGNSTPSKAISYGITSASATPHRGLFSPPQQQQQQQQLLIGSEFTYVQSRKSRTLIVDYGHEEGPMSPEAEDGEIVATGRVMYGEQLQTSDGETREKKSPGIPRLATPSTQATPPQLLEPVDQSEPGATSHALNEAESGGTQDAVMVSVEEQKSVDPLENFLPPPPKAKCSEDLQMKIIKFLALKKKTGRSFNSEVRNRKEYRNPDFLLHAVTYQDIDQIGSCFPKDVFDPHGYDKSDFYDEIEADMRREMERKEQERKRNQKMEFASAGVQPGIVPTPKINVPTPGPTAVAGVLNVTPATSDVTARDARQNKKSKWDKVDGDQRNPLGTGGLEKLSAVGAHAALLSAAKAGSSGYSAFAQQRRKEAEDKRSSDKRLERRS